MNGINVHIYQSVCTHESRLLRLTNSISNACAFDKICIVGRHEPGLAEQERLDEKREIWRVRTKLIKRYSGIWKVLATLEWAWRLIWLCRKYRITCVNSHSLVVLPLCVLLKWMHRSKLVYDTHELETETSTSKGVRKWLAKWIERCLIGFADEVVTVTDSIGHWYCEQYGLDQVTVLRNTPRRTVTPIEKTSTLKSKLGVSVDQPLFIYQGTLSPGRGIGLLLRVFKTLKDKHVVFVGFGPLDSEIKHCADQYSNIHFHEAVPPSQIATITSGADVGLALLENTSLNHYYCLGNKVFEYIQCGVPAVVSDFPEMAGLVANHECGWAVDVDDEQRVASVISRITWEEIERYAQNARATRSKLVWENEEPQLVRMYERLGLCA